MRLMPKRLRKEAFGRRLWSLMMAKEWTQSDLARFSDIQRASISSYINGQSFPDPKNLQKLARALGMAPEKLLPNVAEMSAKASENPPFQITATRDPKIVWLDVHQLTTSRKARDVSAILDSDDDAPDGN
jgi:transcriptional regulator with XRE-family HTH domain